MIEIKFPAGRTDIARIMSKALAEIAGAPIVVKSAECESTWEERAEEAMRADRPAFGEVYSQMQEDIAARQASEQADLSGAFDGVDNVGVDNAGAGKVDPKGVQFNKDYCSDAAKPYYASGSRKDQWKIKRGVSEDAYDEWYAGELLGDKIENTEDTTPPDLSGAFSGTEAAAGATPPETAVPTTVPELMVTISKWQTAGSITQDHVAQAWASAGTSVGAIFAMDAKAQAGTVAVIYQILAAQAGAA